MAHGDHKPKGNNTMEQRLADKYKPLINIITAHVDAIKEKIYDRIGAEGEKAFREKANLVEAAFLGYLIVAARAAEKKYYDLFGERPEHYDDLLKNAKVGNFFLPDFTNHPLWKEESDHPEQDK